MGPVVVKAILNEVTMPETNPNVPLTAEAIARDTIECVRGGASMVHFHARDAEGAWKDNVEYYRSAALGFRKEVDVLWYPPQEGGPTPQQRWAHVQDLARDPAVRMETISIDPGVPSLRPGMEGEGPRSQSDGMPRWQHWVWFCEESQRLGIKPIFGVFGPENIRRIVYWAEIGIVDEPIVLNFHFREPSEDVPATVETIQSYLRMIPSAMKAEWFLSPLWLSMDTQMRLLAYAITHGGHVQVGVGRPPIERYGDRKPPTNAELVSDMVELIGKLGKRPATPAETRDIFGVAAMRARLAAGQPVT